MRRRCFLGGLVLCALASAMPVEAAAPGGSSLWWGRRLFSKTVTTTVYEATLSTADDVDEPDANGLAQFTEVVVEVTFWGRTWTSTCTTLTVSVSDLSDSDGTVVEFILNGDSTPLGTAVVTGGAASLSLSSKRGNTVPDIIEDDDILVRLANDGGDIAEGTFGPATTTTTNCGR